MVPAFRSCRWAAVLVLALACGGGGGGGGGGITNPPPPPPSGPSNPSTASVNMTSSTDAYGYESNAFNPVSVTIARNGTVSWVNNTSVAHSVSFTTSGAPANIPSHTMAVNSRTFPTAGTFNYMCSNHPAMTGSVVVD